MQMKLIAAAIVGLIAVPALAQTNVTISGRIRRGLGELQTVRRRQTGT